MPLLLISGDNAVLAAQLAGSVTRQHPNSQLLDLSGTGLEPTAQRFNPLQELEQRWPPLRERLSGWLEFLKLEAPSAHQIPLVPGAEDLLRLLVLLDHGHLLDTGTLTVLLPPWSHAHGLLHSLVCAPDWIQQIYVPLLQRLSQLKDTVARLEGLLNLRLPEGSTLVLPDALMANLERLRNNLIDPSRCELMLAIGAAQAKPELLAERICSFYLSGVQVSRLWVQGALDAPTRQEILAMMGPAHVLFSDAAQPCAGEAEAWLAKAWQGEADCTQDTDTDGTAVVALLLPGCTKEGLQVQQVGHTLQVRHWGSRRNYPLPSACLGLAPCGARVQGRRLEVRFR